MLSENKNIPEFESDSQISFRPLTDQELVDYYQNPEVFEHTLQSVMEDHRSFVSESTDFVDQWNGHMDDGERWSDDVYDDWSSAYVDHLKQHVRQTLQDGYKDVPWTEDVIRDIADAEQDTAWMDALEDFDIENYIEKYVYCVEESGGNLTEVCGEDYEQLDDDPEEYLTKVAIEKLAGRMSTQEMRDLINEEDDRLSEDITLVLYVSSDPLSRKEQRDRNPVLNFGWEHWDIVAEITMTREEAIRKELAERDQIKKAKKKDKDIDR